MSKELNEFLKKSIKRPMKTLSSSLDFDLNEGGILDSSLKPFDMNGLCQWTTNDGKRFLPSSNTSKKLVPGVYDILQNNTVGLYFEQIPVLTTELIRFPETNSDKVVSEIQNFWKKEDVFKKYNLTYKRGIILWGPPGSGKSSTIQFIMRDVVDRDGIVIRFTHPSLFLEGVRKFREIQPDTPIVVLMEDIDSILEHHSESDVLNILDGVNQIEKVVFLATTNYPENLGPRIINRPSRFDKRFKIGHPNAESRRIYFEHVIGKENLDALEIDLDKWVEDTEEFSIAHLKELFTAVVILGDQYQDAIETLSLMKEDQIDSSHDESKPQMGFGVVGKKKRKG
jgi:SpoVK/Ycf46/Vps4 family AAA+-type ATPase